MLRVCSGAFRNTPVIALRRTKLALYYWVKVKANKQDLSIKCLKEKDWEQAGETKQFSLGNSMAKQAGDVLRKWYQLSAGPPHSFTQMALEIPLQGEQLLQCICGNRKRGMDGGYVRVDRCAILC